MLKHIHVIAPEKDFCTLACRWIDAEGRPVELPATINPIGSALPDLWRIAERSRVAGGQRKLSAILAALQGGHAPDPILVPRQRRLRPRAQRKTGKAGQA